MFGFFKFLKFVFSNFIQLIDPNRNALKDAPPQIKYIASILLASFWALAFSLYTGELFYLGYNLIGHVAIVTMAFVTWIVFQHFRNTYTLRNDYYVLRDPNHSPKCYELTDLEREQAAKKLYS